MPRINDTIQKSVVFLFPSEDAALKNEKAGGTGFIVDIKSDDSQPSKYYLVTSSHVAIMHRNNTVRINTKQNGIEFLQINDLDWTSHPHGDDIAICKIDKKTNWDLKALVWKDLAATSPRIKELNIGVGDEIFMIGRFVAHNGINYNQPLARFGNIAMMPGNPVMDGRKLEVEAFLGEMRSISGFSGSPVFVYLAPGAYRGNKTMMPFYSETIGLIGIDTGHLEMKGKTSESNLITLQNSGVTIISPIWKIKETIEKAESED